MVFAAVETEKPSSNTYKSSILQNYLAFSTPAFYAAARVVSMVPRLPYLLASMCSLCLLVFFP